MAEPEESLPPSQRGGLKTPAAIGLRPMRPDEFPAFLAYFIPDYATEIAANFGLPDDAARARAAQEVAEDLPQGVDTQGRTLLCITLGDPEEVVGSFWLRLQQGSTTAFVSDFHIFPARQNRGLGRRALAALDRWLASAGFEHLRLRVAADNVRARHLYETGGFRTTGINMTKPVGRPA
jgi:ribosomal protein S18 acetylase RimI-like enzyme